MLIKRLGRERIEREGGKDQCLPYPSMHRQTEEKKLAIRNETLRRKVLQEKSSRPRPGL